MQLPVSNVWKLAVGDLDWDEDLDWNFSLTYDARLSVGMSTIYQRVVNGLWVCLCLCVCKFGRLWACGVGILKTSVSFNYYDLFWFMYLGGGFGLICVVVAKFVLIFCSGCGGGFWLCVWWWLVLCLFLVQFVRSMWSSLKVIMEVGFNWFWFWVFCNRK